MVRPPVDSCFGTSPSQAPKSRPLLEPGAGADRRHHGRRDDRSHAWHAHQALTVLILNSERFDLCGDRRDALIEPVPVFHHIDNEANHTQ